MRSIVRSWKLSQRVLAAKSSKFIDNFTLKQFKDQHQRKIIWKPTSLNERFWKFSSDKELKGKSTIFGGLKEVEIDSKDCIQSLLSFTDEERRAIEKSRIDIPFTNEEEVATKETPERLSRIVLSVNGELSLEKEEDSPAQHTGYAAAVSEKFIPSIDGTQYESIEMVVKTDGRGYVANLTVYTEYDDIVFQTFFTTEPNKWTLLTIPLENFSMSWEGFTNNNQISHLKHNIDQFGILMAERKEGPFSFELASISLVSENADVIQAMRNRKKKRFDALPDFGIQ